MTCSKGQIVTLTDTAMAGLDCVGRARVIEIVYTEQPLGQRGVRLDQPLNGETWWLESSLEAAI